MKPEIEERLCMLLAGMMGCGKTVQDIDIHHLWDIYGLVEPAIENRLEGSWYELHVGTTEGKGIHSVLAGVAISEVGELPIEASVKVIPAGQYAHFAHCMKDGGFDIAFAQVETWVKETGTATRDFGLQMYDSNYNPEDENSILHIYIPLA
jgi:predicted transcriptional regulator YdeE